MNCSNTDWPGGVARVAMKWGLVAGMVLLLGLLPAPSRGAEKGTGPWDVILGARGGYALFLGPYRDDFRDSYRAGAFCSFGNQALLKFLMGEVDFEYGRHAMRGSGKSYLQLFSGSIGPLAVFPAARYFHPYAGVAFRGSYVHLHAERSRSDVKSFKPGFLARIGCYVPIRRGFRLRFGADYSLEYLSGRPLHGLAFTGGVAYNFGWKQGGGHEGDDESLRVERLLAQGRAAMKGGRVEDAKASFRAVLAIRPGNPEATDAMAGIEKAESDFARAMKLAGTNRLIDALALLDDAATVIPAARVELERIRRLVAGEVPNLERRGIELYEQGDYRGCIATMKRLLLIDPNNKAGLLYLPRAQRRQEALERLR